MKRIYEEKIGGSSGGVPPLPIPNREVKPSSLPAEVDKAGADED